MCRNFPPFCAPTLTSSPPPQSNITPFLIKLTDRCKEEGIKVGSYPTFGVGVDVSLIGTDLARLQELGRECEKELEGEIVAQGKIGEAASRKD